MSRVERWRAEKTEQVRYWQDRQACVILRAMPRAARVAPGRMVFHVLNRAIARVRVFEKNEDFAAFERTLNAAEDKDQLKQLRGENGDKSNY